MDMTRRLEHKPLISVRRFQSIETSSVSRISLRKVLDKPVANTLLLTMTFERKRYRHKVWYIRQDSKQSIDSLFTYYKLFCWLTILRTDRKSFLRWGTGNKLLCLLQIFVNPIITRSLELIDKDPCRVCSWRCKRRQAQWKQRRHGRALACRSRTCPFTVLIFTLLPGHFHFPRSYLNCLMQEINNKIGLAPEYLT